MTPQVGEWDAISIPVKPPQDRCCNCVSWESKHGALGYCGYHKCHTMATEICTHYVNFKKEDSL